jgi:hypothetical protein
MERDSVVGILTKIDLIEYLAKRSVEAVAVPKAKALKPKSTAGREPRRVKKTARNGARA